MVDTIKPSPHPSVQAHRTLTLDRLTHHVNILEMNGDSYRLAQSRGRKGIAINQGQDRLALAGQSA